ncbi:MAG TPA: DUF2080 family transposase-associated protein [archaeon]|nr:DUF2080 family transposase-associated protein [archaeon]
MLKTVDVQESVEKEVVKFGNGSIVYTQKKWIGKKVLVVLEKKPLDIEGGAMEALKPFLSSVEGVFLFGSHARNEQTEKSDIDILAITDKKISVGKIGRLDFLLKTREEFTEEIKADPTLFLQQAINEAKPIFNESLLKELRKIRANPDFGEFLGDTLGAFKKTKELIEAGRGKEFLDSNTAIYSLILRMKGLFIIQCFKRRAGFSGKKFAGLLKSHGFTGKTADNLIEAYRAERDERKTTIKILVSDAEKLFEAAKIEFIKTEALVKK